MAKEFRALERRHVDAFANRIRYLEKWCPEENELIKEAEAAYQQVVIKYQKFWHEIYDPLARGI